MSEQLLKVKDLVEWMNVPRYFVYEHTRSGTTDPLPAFKIGKHLRFKKNEVEKWLEEHKK